MFATRNVVTLGPVSLDLSQLTVDELTRLNTALVAEVHKRDAQRFRDQRADAKEIVIPVVGPERSS